MIDVVVVADRAALGAAAAAAVRAAALAGGLRVLGVATGSSPEPLYAELARHPLPGAASLEVVALDEYAGLPPGHPQSYRCVVEAQVRAPLGLDPARTHVPDGSATDLDAESARYEALVSALGGVDLQVLGIGANGHLGFNEPGSPLGSTTRVVELSARTRADNARFFTSPEEVPHRAVTQGLGTIARARHHLLLASGAGKAEAVARALTGPVGPACPASLLQRVARATVVLDEAAAAHLERKRGARR